MSGFEVGVLVGFVWSGLLAVTLALFSGARGADRAPEPRNPLRGAERRTEGPIVGVGGDYWPALNQWQVANVRRFWPNAPKLD